MRKLNNKGFTVVELLTSFTLASVVMILLTNILLTIKENYLQNKLEVELESQVALLSRRLNEDATNCTATSFGQWGSFIDFNDTPSCDFSSMKLTITQEDDRAIATIKKYDISGTVSDDKYEFPKGTSVSATGISRIILTNDKGNELSYLLVQFDINATMPMTGEKKTKHVKVLYNYAR